MWDHLIFHYLTRRWHENLATIDYVHYRTPLPQTTTMLTSGPFIFLLSTCPAKHAPRSHLLSTSSHPMTWSCNTGHISCNLPSLWANNNLRRVLVAKARPPMWLPQIPSWSLAIILMHFSPCTHTKRGCVNPNLYTFFFIFLASVGSIGSTPSAM